MSSLKHLTPEQLAKYNAQVNDLRTGLLRFILESNTQDSGIAMDALLQALLTVGHASNRGPELRMAFASHASDSPATSNAVWLQKH